MKYLFFLILVVGIYTSVYSQSNSSVRANDIVDARGEVYIEFEASPKEISGFVDIMSVDHYDGRHVKAYANRKQFVVFCSLNRDFNLVEDYYRDNKSLTMASTVAQMSNWDRYPTFDVYVEMMESFANDFPINFSNLQTSQDTQ